MYRIEFEIIDVNKQTVSSPAELIFFGLTNKFLNENLFTKESCITNMVITHGQIIKNYYIYDALIVAPDINDESLRVKKDFEKYLNKVKGVCDLESFKINNVKFTPSTKYEDFDQIEFDFRFDTENEEDIYI